MSPERVHIVDDDADVRKSLAFLLRSAGMDVKTYESAKEFLAAASALGHGCIVTDVRMPGMSGLELQRRLQELEIRLPVIIMTGHGDVPLAVEALKAGAADFIEKPFQHEVLLAAVRSALDANRAQKNRDAEKDDILARLESLSPRERQVFDGVVAGRPNKAIAIDLQISPRTVEVFRANLMIKMQAEGLSDLVRMALVTGALQMTKT